VETPLIFFVHVPKTAGSTINTVLHERIQGGRSHCEAFVANKDEFQQSATTCRWLSGHIDLSTVEKALASTTRELRLFTCMRDPVKHVMSHYNWLIEIYHRGRDFYEAHPARIKEISETIRSSQQDGHSIAGILSRFPGLFLNGQSRMILGKGFNWNTGMVHQRIGRYEMIVDSNNVDMLITHLLGKPAATIHRENVSRYHFDPTAFDTDEMRDFLRTHNTLDEMLYNALALRSEGGSQ
jgi:hypothetical protein